MDFTIEAGFFGRFFRSPVFVLDAGDSAMLISEETFYGDPKRARPTAGGYQILFGKSFYSFPDVDYAFQSFPASISIDSKSSKAVRKTRVDVLLVSPGGVFLGLVRDQRTDEALGLAEWRLRRQPEDEGMLEMYVRTAQQVRKGAQAGAFLQPGLARRPVQISWHRLYQELRSQESGRGSLAAEYDAVLQADPENSSLLYLRGRICPRHSLALPFLQRAAAKDPRNAYAQHALGYIRSSQGDWAGSRDFAAKACELAPENDAFLEALFRSRFALQEYDPLETEIRDGLVKEPLNVRLAARLCDVLVAKNQAADAEQFLSSFEKSFLSQIKEDIGNSCRSLRQHLQYARGDFAALAGAPGKDEADRIARVRGLLEQMKVKEASEALAANDMNAQDPYHLIILSTGWREIQDEEKAAAFLNSAVTLMEKDSTESSVVAALLKESEPPSIDAVRDLVQDPIQKAITLVSLAQRHPAKAAEYLELARVLNTDLAYPHHWISRLTEKPGN